MLFLFILKSISKMTTTIRVTPFAVDVNGAEEEYGEEIGTYGWYIVADALEKYAGGLEL